MNKKTKKMVAVEERFNQALETMLPPLVTERGLSATAEEIGVSKATNRPLYLLIKSGPAAMSVELVARLIKLCVASAADVDAFFVEIVVLP